jgi:hypothetical protein
MHLKPTEACPLTWPPGWKRTPAAERTRAKFSKQAFVDRGVDSATGKRMGHNSFKEISIGQGTERVLEELNRMGFNRSVVISSDLRLRNDGLPLSNQRPPDDPGVAVYWGTGKGAHCIAVDRYHRIADNLAAIAASLEAMRAIERHGGAAILDRAFTGFVALPAPEQWFQVLGVTANATREQIDEAYRRLAMKAHPDRDGGSSELMARLNSAREDGIGNLHA